MSASPLQLDFGVWPTQSQLEDCKGTPKLWFQGTSVGNPAKYVLRKWFPRAGPPFLEGPKTSEREGQYAGGKTPRESRTGDRRMRRAIQLTSSPCQREGF